MRLTKAGSKREAVVGILRDYIRRRRMAELTRYAGSFPDDFPTNEEIEAADLPRGRAQHARIDSSLWVHFFRRSGDAAKRERVKALLAAGEAAWCPPVRLELWRGVGGKAERDALSRMQAVLPDFPVTPPVWDSAIALAGQSRAAGLVTPSADYLIFACARLHGVELAHDDAHFDQLRRLLKS